jgi:hypothetical protein
MKAGRDPKTFEEVRSITEKWGEDKTFVGTDGKTRKLRGHSITDDKVKNLLMEWHRTGRFISPYSRGPRTDHLIALAELGVNKAWSLAEILNKLQEIMSRPDHVKNGVSAWSKFTSKKRQNLQPVMDRIYDNFRSFRRLCKRWGRNPYGFRLRQIGCCIDIFVDATNRGKKYIRLNTFSSEPLKIVVDGREGIPEVDMRGTTLGPR